MRRLIFFTFLFILQGFCSAMKNDSFSAIDETLIVRRCEDFSITGKGDHPEWAKAGWHHLKKLDPQGDDYETKFKILYSATGIYVLFFGTDNKISTVHDQDFGDLYLGDVFEVFFHPEPALPLYFEYEVNQLNKELVLLIPNIDGSFYGWKPWHYEGARMVKKMVTVDGGTVAPGAAIRSWSAELFFPFELLRTFPKTPPVSGTVWNANFYRLDYDSGSMVKWAWSPVDKHFHEFRKYQPIRFE